MHREINGANRFFRSCARLQPVASLRGKKKRDRVVHVSLKRGSRWYFKGYSPHTMRISLTSIYHVPGHISRTTTSGTDESLWKGFYRWFVLPSKNKKLVKFCNNPLARILKKKSPKRIGSVFCVHLALTTLIIIYLFKYSK